MLFAFVLVISLTACSQFSPDDASNAVSYEGKALIIELEENPTTGFSWSYTISDTDVIHLVEDVYTEDSEDPEVVGGGGMHQYKFEGLSAGEATIIFDYFKSWEGEETAEDHVEYTVIVNEDGTIAEVNQ
nr:protease inhibitor I42 family protein [Proteiniclasticum aestuarii]